MEMSAEWTCLPITGPRPSPRSFAAMVVFEGFLLLHGGRSADSTFDDTWICKLPSGEFVRGEDALHSTSNQASWCRLVFDDSPPPLAYHTAVIAGTNVVLYGGRDVGGNYYGNMHVLSMMALSTALRKEIGKSSVLPSEIDVSRLGVRWFAARQGDNHPRSRAYHIATMLPMTAAEAEDIRMGGGSRRPNLGKMVVAGGHSPQFFLDFVSVFDFQEQEWTHVKEFDAANAFPKAHCLCGQPRKGPNACAMQDPSCVEAGGCLLPSLHNSYAMDECDGVASAYPRYNPPMLSLGSQAMPARDAAAGGIRRHPVTGRPMLLMHGGELQFNFSASLFEIDCQFGPVASGNRAIREHAGYREDKEGPTQADERSADWHCTDPCAARREANASRATDGSDGAVDNSANFLHHCVAPTNRAYHSGFVAGEAFFVWGGYQHIPSRFFNDMYAFDFLTETWELVEQSGDVPTPRASPSVAVSEWVRDENRFDTAIPGDPNGDSTDSVVFLFGGDDGPSGYTNELYACKVKRSPSLKYQAAALLNRAMPELVEPGARMAPGEEDRQEIAEVSRRALRRRPPLGDLPESQKGCIVS